MSFFWSVLQLSSSRGVPNRCAGCGRAPTHCPPEACVELFLGDRRSRAFHRAMTSLYWALALATASISLVVGATSAACIAIAAAIIAAPTLTKVGGPLGA